MSERRDLVHEREDLTLKIASRKLVRAAGGTDGAAATVGTRQPRMSDVGLPNTAAFLRIDEVRKLEEVTVGQPGWPQVTRALAALTGHVLVRLPSAPDGETAWHRALGALAKEIGDIVERLCAALADGIVTGGEIRAKGIRAEIAEAMELLAALDAMAARAEAEEARG